MTGFPARDVLGKESQTNMNETNVKLGIERHYT